MTSIQVVAEGDGDLCLAAALEKDLNHYLTLPALPFVAPASEAMRIFADAERMHYHEFGSRVWVSNDPQTVEWFFVTHDTWSPDNRAEQKSVALLKSWLSEDQLFEYNKDRCFTVKGSDTSKRYRIRHGFQMNIDELDDAGKKTRGWCFMPEGNLATGDVMLAQKIALETNENEALKVANEQQPWMMEAWNTPTGGLGIGHIFAGNLHAP